MAETQEKDIRAAFKRVLKNLSALEKASPSSTENTNS